MLMLHYILAEDRPKDEARPSEDRKIRVRKRRPVSRPCVSHVCTHAFTSCLVERASCRRSRTRDAALVFHDRHSSATRIQSHAHGVLVASK